MNKLTGMIVYCMVDKPNACYDKDKGHEWKCGIVVDEDTADTFNETYPKQPAKKVKRTDFEATYKTAPPEGSEKNLYVITLRKNVKLANGESVPDKYRPRVFEQVGNKLVDVTTTKLPGNGSMGEISIDHYENDYGATARLRNIKITEMIEYEGTTNTYEPGDEFSDDAPAKEVKKPAAKSAKAPAAPKKSEVKEPVKSGFDDMDDDIPF